LKTTRRTDRATDPQARRSIVSRYIGTRRGLFIRVRRVGVFLLAVAHGTPRLADVKCALGAGSARSGDAPSRNVDSRSRSRRARTRGWPTCAPKARERDSRPEQTGDGRASRLPRLPTRDRAMARRASPPSNGRPAPLKRPRLAAPKRTSAAAAPSRHGPNMKEVKSGELTVEPCDCCGVTYYTVGATRYTFCDRCLSGRCWRCASRVRELILGRHILMGRSPRPADAVRVGLRGQAHSTAKCGGIARNARGGPGSWKRYGSCPQSPIAADGRRGRACSAVGAGARSSPPPRCGSTSPNVRDVRRLLREACSCRVWCEHGTG